MLRRYAIIAAFGLYMGVGSLSASLLMTAIPAVNWMGAAYIALTWPAWIKGSPVKLPVPRWAFTFEAAHG